MHADRQTGSDEDRLGGRQIDRQRERQIVQHLNRQVETQAGARGRQTERWAGRQRAGIRE